MKKVVKRVQEQPWLIPKWVDDAIGGVPEGSRHNTAIGLVGRWYGKGLHKDEVAMLLVMWNQKNEPPMSLDEVKLLYKSTTKWELPRLWEDDDE